MSEIKARMLSISNEIEGIKFIVALKTQALKKIAETSGGKRRAITYASNILEVFDFDSNDKVIQKIASFLVNVGILIAEKEDDKSKLIVSNYLAAQELLNILPDESSFVTFEQKIRYQYYFYLFNGDPESFTKNAFDLLTSDEVLEKPSVSFKSEEDVQKYLLSVFSIDCESEETDIVAVEENFGKWDLLMNEKQRWAIIFSGRKLKAKKKEAPKSEIDEFKLKKNKTEDVGGSLCTLNEHNLEQLDKVEVVNLVANHSGDIDEVYFLSVANSGKKFEYLLEIIEIEK